LPKVKKKRKKKQNIKKKEKTKKVFLYVLKILCWKSLKSKKVKHWWLKMKNLCALIKYLVWNIIFQNALLSLVWTFSFTLFYLTLTLAP
jgi:branched-subunit amino acid transport protein AzlD